MNETNALWIDNYLIPAAARQGGLSLATRAGGFGSTVDHGVTAETHRKLAVATGTTLRIRFEEQFLE